MLIKNIFSMLYVFSFLIQAPVLLAQDEVFPITTSSEDAKSFFLEGRYKFENMQYPTAAALFEHAINADPDFALAYLYRSQSEGGFNVLWKNLRMAVTLIDKVTDAEKKLILYYKANFDGDAVSQKNYLDELLGLFPNSKRIQNLAGVYYYRSGHYQNAIEYFKEAIELDPEFAAPYNLLGYSYYYTEKFSDAENAFKKYISLIPNNPNPYDSYAEFLLRQGRFEESLVNYRKALEADPAFTSSMQGIAENYIFLKNYDKARQYYDMQYAYSPNINGKMDALFFKAVSFIHENKINDALNIIFQQRELAEKEGLLTDLIGTFNTAGFILTETGEAVKGLEELNKGLEIINGSNFPPEVKDGLLFENIMNRCHALTVQKKLDDAELLADEAEMITEKRGNPLELRFLYSRRARLNLAKENYEEAIKYYLLSDMNDPYHWFYIGFCYKALGQEDKAKEYFDRIKDTKTNSLGYAFVINRVE